MRPADTISNVIVDRVTRIRIDPILSPSIKRIALPR